MFVSRSSEETLNNFATYRYQELRNFPNDNAQLLTGIDFIGDVVGLAFRGALCSSRYSAGINQDYSSLPGLVAAVMAHEIGHNFNMKHDAKFCLCPKERCIMAPSTTSKTAYEWSTCSKDSLETFLKDGMDFCLTNMPKQLALPACGNGIVELNEQCDCGLSQFCNSSCCNSTTCELTTHSACASGSCCDLETCQLKKISTTCRHATSECDLPEFCNGKSPSCPSDVFLQNGAQCPTSEGICYQGKCRSRQLQCQALWETDAEPSDPCCYNLLGSRKGNCGTGDIERRYQSCETNSSNCERLQCSPINKATLSCSYGENAKPLIYHNRCRSPYHHRDQSPQCFGVSLDFGLNTPDPGLVDTGTICGENKVCFQQECVPLERLKSESCLNGCSNNGVCNSKGQCHCFIGFGPPSCAGPGPGGSSNSGPPMDSNVESLFVKTMYVLFFFIVPLILIVSSIFYWYCCMKGNVENESSRSIAVEEESKTKISPKRGLKRSLSRKLSAQIQSMVSNPMPYGRFDEDNEETTEFDRV